MPIAGQKRAGHYIFIVQCRIVMAQLASALFHDEAALIVCQMKKIDFGRIIYGRYCRTSMSLIMGAELISRKGTQRRHALRQYQYWRQC